MEECSEFVFSYLGNWQMFYKWLPQFAFWPKMNEVSGMSSSSLTLDIVILLIMALPLGAWWYLTVDFDLHFPDDEWYWLSFCVLTNHSYILFNEALFKYLGHLLDVFCTLMTELWEFFRCSRWMQDHCWMYSLQMFFDILWYLFLVFMNHRLNVKTKIVKV